MSMMIEASLDGVIDYALQLTPAELEKLMAGIVHLLVEQSTTEQTGLLLPEQYENDEMRQIRQQWEAERANGTLDQQEDLSWMEGLSQDEIVARLKAEWQANVAAREIELANEPIPPPQDTFSEAYGLLLTDKPGPSDEEVKQWLQERRMKKYG